MDSIDGVVFTIINEFHWTPHYIDTLYCDDIDHFGIKYLYDNILEMHKKIPQPKTN